MRGRWTTEEEDKLRELFDTELTYAEIGEILSKTEAAVTKKVARMGLNGIRIHRSPSEKTIEKLKKTISKTPRTPRPTDWSEADLNMLKNLYLAGMPDREIGELLGRTQTAVKVKRGRLSLVGAHDFSRISKEGRKRMAEKPKGEESPSWQGGRRVNHNGYIEIHMPGHHRARGNGYVFEHILVLEEKIGRKLANDEVCHHADGNRSNNHPGNLFVVKKSEHARLHPRRRKRVTLICPICRNEFKVKPSRKDIRKTCGMACAKVLFRNYYTGKPTDYRPTEEAQANE